MKVTIISPASRQANNGNWHTAYRWSRFLRPYFDVAIRSDWPADCGAHTPPQCLVALHARRSAAAIERFALSHPGHPVVLVLTGTDLYRDLPADASARRSLALAAHLVVLQDAALEELDPVHRPKCRVIYQSARALQPGAPRQRTFDAVLVGHMRAEKDPLTPMRALRRLPDKSRVRLIHIGDALEEQYRVAARAAQSYPWPSVPRYHWLGPLPHAETRQRMRRARLMVISSVMEGGANVIVEAVTAGIPVLASRIPGNIGMLGRDYDGYFAASDEGALAALLERAEGDPSFLAHLREQCALRSPLFAPEREARAVKRLLEDACRGLPQAERPGPGHGGLPINL